MYHLTCAPVSYSSFFLLSPQSHGAMPPPPGQCADRSWSLNHVTGDLFSCPPDEALAHCISEDCRMGAGIAVLFKRRFKGVEDLKEQRKTALSSNINQEMSPFAGIFQLLFLD